MMMLMILTMMIVVVVVIVMIWLQYGGPHRETLPKFFCKLKKSKRCLKKFLQDTVPFLTLDQDSACFKDSQEIYSSDF